jgi:hypothetical protein
MAFVLLLACGMAALVYPTRLGAAALITVAFALFSLAVVGICIRRGDARPFWVGVATCGWLSWMVHFGPWFDEYVAPDLLTTAALQIAAVRILPPPSTAAATTAVGSGGMRGVRARMLGAAFPAPTRPTRGMVFYFAPGTARMFGNGMVGRGVGMGSMGMGGMGGGMGMGGATLYIPDLWEEWTRRQANGAGGTWLPAGAYAQSGYALFCLLFAFAGGFVAKLYASREVPQAT